MSGVAVADRQGGSGTVQFQNGAVIYRGTEAGLMASINIELNHIRYELDGSGQFAPTVDRQDVASGRDRVGGMSEKVAS
jgi:hypothetical protein